MFHTHVLFRCVELAEHALLCPITLRKSVLLLLLKPVFLVLSSVVSENCRMTLVPFLLRFLQQHKKKSITQLWRELNVQQQNFGTV